ncbi:uncharacterized protein J3D65DRAFT_384660 [Phyllosticta citribraziliensis]|uniref:Secreted protein n=1 Tax=Phyllosticta citribraziliensis TaxID=989973 RepID=A0ABR1LQN0_9PEZI
MPHLAVGCVWRSTRASALDPLLFLLVPLNAKRLEHEIPTNQHHEIDTIAALLPYQQWASLAADSFGNRKLLGLPAVHFEAPSLHNSIDAQPKMLPQHALNWSLPVLFVRAGFA